METDHLSPPPPIPLDGLKSEIHENRPSQKFIGFLLSTPGMMIITFIITFLLLLLIRPRFVMKTPETVIETPKIAYIRIFIISLAVSMLVPLVGLLFRPKTSK